jgi:phosphoribosylanthranilate isomerase
MLLIDAQQPGEFGGTGIPVDWNLLRRELDGINGAGLPLILAGGLTPDNVAEAVAIVRPEAVDIATGVEYAPGRKDADLVNRFIDAANNAFERLPRR